MQLNLTAPAAKGFDAERLNRIPAFVQERYLANGKLPNALVLIGRDDDVVYLSVQGSAGQGGEHLAADSIFRIASMTKPIASVALMMLVEEGKLALDTPVHRVIPEWKELGVYVGGGNGEPFRSERTKSPMRVVDLMRHTSGLTYGFQSRTPVDAAYRDLKIGEWHGTLDLDQAAAALAKVPLEFSPGEAWNYSVSTDFVGLIVQRLSGQPFEDFLQQRIFDPLKMTDTGFHVPEAKRARLCDAYHLLPGRSRELNDSGENSRWLHKPKFVSGGGGLVSTAADYHRFCRMLLRGGELDGQRLLGPATIRLMTQNHLPGGADLTEMSRSLFSEATYAGTGFGLGFGVTIDPARTLMPGSPGSYYWGGMYSTYFLIDPAEGLLFIFMTQLMPSTTYPVRRELQTMLYASLTQSRR